MRRKRLTQLFPWFLPLRKKQRLLCFYAGLSLDGNHYSSQQTETLLSYQLFETSCPMYNFETEFDMVYQVSDSKLRETQKANYCSILYLVDCAVLSMKAQSYQNYGTASPLKVPAGAVKKAMKSITIPWPLCDI